MPFTIGTGVTCYLLPDDGAVGQQAFLKNLLAPAEPGAVAGHGGHATHK